MKYLTFIALFFLIIPELLQAQESEQQPRLDVMTSVASSQLLGNIELMIFIPNDFSENSYRFSSGEDNSGLIMISGRPYSEFELGIPDETAFENQFGMSAVLDDYQLMWGAEPDSDLMEVISPSECSEMTVPESGELYIRIGGTVETEDRLRGVYTGTISLSCTDE
jgi:hypothetical protein